MLSQPLSPVPASPALQADVQPTGQGQESVPSGGRRPSQALLQIFDQQETKPQAAPQQQHPLSQRWTLWFDQTNPSQPWGANLTTVASFETVEQFWYLYSNVIQAAELRDNCYFHLFRDGIKPAWEDERNKTGGRFRFNVPRPQVPTNGLMVPDQPQPRHQPLTPAQLEAVRNETNRLWLTTLLVLIGDQLPGAEMVTGANVFKKHGNQPPRIELWVDRSELADRQSLDKLGRRYLELCQYNDVLHFKPHTEQKKTNRTFTLTL